MSKNKHISQEDVEKLAERQMVQESISGTSRKKKENKNELINVESVKKQLRKALLGVETKLVKTNDGRLVKKNIKQREEVRSKLCNEKCVNEIFSTIEAQVNKNISGSYLSKRDVFVMGWESSQAITDKLYVYQEKFDIDGPSDASQIMSIVNPNLKASIKKALNARLMKHGEQTKEIREMRKSSEGEESKGRFFKNVLG